MTNDLKRFAALYALMIGGTTPGEREAARKKLEGWLERHDKKWSDVGSLVAQVEAENTAAAQSAQNDERRANADAPPEHDKYHALELVHHLLGSYLDLKDHELVAVALWVLHSHVYDRFPISPRLALLSPTRGCGKTETFKMLNLLCQRPDRIDSTSVAAIYWLIEAQHPTLLIDEGDNLGLVHNGTLRAVMNSGHIKGGVVTKVIGGEVKKFSTFAPMAIAAIGNLPLPLTQRSLVVHMERTTRTDLKKVPDGDKPDKAIDYVYMRVRQWAASVTLDDPDMPKELRNRQADNWRSLLSIADSFGWGDKAREAAHVFRRDFHDEDVCVILIGDIREVFNTHALDADLLGWDANRMSSAELTKRLHEVETGDWSEYRGEREDQQPHKLTQAELARMLRTRFRIRPKTVWPTDRSEGSRQGYSRDQFETVWSKYLEPEPAPEPEQVAIAAE
jgi:hypothetical protein